MIINRQRWLTRIIFWAIRWSPEPDAEKDLAQRMKRMNFESNTQRLGVRMNERLRDRLRRNWLRLSKKP
ncbi:MAG: hypothetical protein GXY44_13930 [Phycisphaerales bacterium]|nr:hypothetical protein [Phycisphaerales bacterium]